MSGRCVGLIQGHEPALQPIGVIAARVGPEDDRRRGMITLAADDDLVSLALHPLADSRLLSHCLVVKAQNRRHHDSRDNFARR